MGVALQSRTSKYGIGRLYTEKAVGHGRIALLLTPVKNGGITRVRRVGDAIKTIRRPVTSTNSGTFSENTKLTS